VFTVAGKPVGSEETGWLRVSRGSFMKCVRVKARASCMGIFVQLYDIKLAKSSERSLSAPLCPGSLQDMRVLIHQGHIPKILMAKVKRAKLVGSTLSWISPRHAGFNPSGRHSQEVCNPVGN